MNSRISTMHPQGVALQKAFFEQLPGARQAFTLFDFVPNVSFFAKDWQGRFMKVNPRFYRDHGCTSEAEMLGTTDYDYHMREMAQRYVDEDRSVMASGKPLPDQIWLVPGSDGMLHWFVSTKMPLFDLNGKVIGLSGAMRDAESEGSLLGPYAAMTPVVHHVMQHSSQSIRISDLARLVNLSISQFERNFRKLFGMTPIAYLQRVRLHESARALRKTNHTVGQIAVECGFYDQSSFTRLFRKQYGVTPGGFRRRSASSESLPA
jgi:AraC-like DNA-binding protein